ncbi:MFS transporter [Phototrophicus methaneseepsis]|uniref:MFS transporter n=1 Tax=Phototrophicus methaneseepsis TaxID=2710758 RepID=A0A7S8E784_9CHLR|nr:MFS transporter [Phototrophicus methaneseepsis]QPC81641.1 MFS transporter [Phototrophicus methaneseepsis]
MKNYWNLLKNNPQLTKLWLAQVISLLGDWFNTVVLSTLVAEFTEGSGLAVSIFLMSRFLPPLLVSPFAGVLVDRLNRKHLLIWSNILRALIVPLFLLATGPEHLWLIYAVTIAQFTLSAIFEPGQSAIIPALTQPDKLVEANTLTSVTWSVMLALGAALGGGFAFLFGPQAALLADAATFAIASGLIMWIDYDPERGRKIQKALEGQTAPEPEEEDTTFMEGVRYALRTPQMLAALFVKFGQSIGNVDTLITIAATQIFIIGNGGEVSLGLLYSAFGLGSFIGPMLTNTRNDGTVPRMRRLIIIGFAAIVVGWLLWGFSSMFIMVLIAVFIRGLGGSINWTYSVIMIQKTAPDAKLGRMFALDFAGFQVATVVTTLIHGWLIDQVPLEHLNWVIIGTGLVAVLPLLAWIWIVNTLEKREATPSFAIVGD